MATVNRESVREEAERIKSEFARISKSKKIDSEYQLLFHSMLMLINLLIAIFLEKTTTKNTKNHKRVDLVLRAFCSTEGSAIYLTMNN